MIVDLAVEGRRVGVTANSHKVIGELLAKVAEVATNRGVAVRIGQRSTEEPTFGDAIHLREQRRRTGRATCQLNRRSRGDNLASVPWKI